MRGKRAFGLGVFAATVGVLGCEDDPSPWTMADAAADVDASADHSTSETSTDETQDRTSGSESSMSSSERTMSSAESSMTDASVSMGDSSSAEASSGGPDGSVTEATSEGSATSGGNTSGGSTTATSSASDVIQTSSGSEASLSASSGAEDSTPDSGVACDAGDCASTSAEESTDQPAPSVCGVEVDPSRGLTLDAVLPAYLATLGPDAGADGGAVRDCYPPCIAALMAECAPSEECTLDADAEADIQACWPNGVYQSQIIEYTGYELMLTEKAYAGDAACITGQLYWDYGDAFVYTWWDGAGNQVAHGTDESGDLVVTCEFDNQDYVVDKEQCPLLGDVLYDQSQCN